MRPHLIAAINAAREDLSRDPLHADRQAMFAWADAHGLDEGTLDTAAEARCVECAGEGTISLDDAYKPICRRCEYRYPDANAGEESARSIYYWLIAKEVA